jgi:hypothetical protein
MASSGVLDPPLDGSNPEDSPVPPDSADQPAGPRRDRADRVIARLKRPESVITLLVVVTACVFTFVQLQPSQLFKNTTPAGGDMGAHVWLPAYLRDHLLPHLRITGWTPDWYAGFPALVFYFPLPSLAIVAASVVVPYTIAFKLISVSGLVALPVAAWAFGRLARMRFPGPACLAAATVPFLFGREFTIYGGNIASTLAGEFSFSISLAFALLFLGLVARGMDTGRYRAWAAVVLLATGLCHLLPTLFAILGAIVLTLIGEERTNRIGWPTRLLGGVTILALLAHLVGLLAWDVALALAVLTLISPALHFDRRRWQWTVPVLVVAGCLAAFWALPFVARLPYATDMGYEKLTAYSSNLFPSHLLWLDILAAVGAFAALIRRQRVGLFFTIMAVLSALIFRFAPQARLWNARVLPFWFLCLYLLAGVAFAEAGSILVEAVAVGDWAGAARWSLLGVPVVTILAALTWVGFPLRILPFGRTNSATGQYSWLGIKSSDRSFVPDWVTWNYSGYQSQGKARRNEYFALVQTMANLGKTDGCGRAMWEYEPEEDQMGTPMALMLLPYWTHSCIGSMEGLYFESSATTPYHFLNAAELSLHPSNPVRGLDYPTSPNIQAGVEHLQMLGVKYYMALTPETQSQADADPNLRLVATSGPWPVSYTTGNNTTTKQRTWKIYEVEDSAIVTPLRDQPVVMNGVSKAGKTWLKPSEAWYLNQSLHDVYYAASGPKSWPRIDPNDTAPPRTPLPPVEVSNIKTGDDNVSFDVDTVGVPVLVKASYFPNWHVSGAKGPYRVTPNLMVVIPTSNHVRLHYGYTSVDIFAMLLSLIGIAGVVWLARAKPVQYPAPRHLRREDTPFDGPADLDAGQIAGPYHRLEYELAGAFPSPRDGPPAGRPDQDLDVWLGFPAGLDLAKYRTADYGQAGRTRRGAWSPPRDGAAVAATSTDGNGAGADDAAPADGALDGTSEDGSPADGQSAAGGSNAGGSNADGAPEALGPPVTDGGGEHLAGDGSVTGDGMAASRPVPSHDFPVVVEQTPPTGDTGVTSQDPPTD